MSKTTLALLLGTGLTLGLAAPTHRAEAATIQTISTPTLSADTFNQYFTPYNTAVLSPFRFDGTSTDSGLIESQVFKGTGMYAGTYAYGYQVVVNPNKDSNGEPVHVDSASFKFNATPLGTDLTGAGKSAFGYVIQNGQIGGLNLSGTQTPTTLSWQPGETTGFIRAPYVDPASQTQALGSGATSATFVLLSTQLPSDAKPSVNVAVTVTVYASVPGSYGPGGSRL